MEFTNLADAVACADRVAELTAEPRYVLQGTGSHPYWVCGPWAKAELWPDREPVHVSAPLANYA